MAEKKIKKVVAPIDERETFVSLQKSFAETGLSVEEKLGILYELQSSDNEIEKILQQRGDLPAEVAALEGEIEGYNSKIASFKASIKELEGAIESNKDQMVELDGDIAKYQKQLESISNSREFDSINKELENLNLLRMIAEKHIREAKEAIESKKADIEGVSDKILILEDDLKAKNEELSVIVESTSEREKDLVAKRDALAAKLDERTVSAYDRIRNSVHNRLAVVPVYNGDSCGGCFNTITPQRIIDVASGKKLVICEHCGRIIVAAPETAEE